MTCVEMRERLDAYADGEDPAPAEVEAHLRGCPSCEAALVELRAEIASINAALGPVALRAEAAAARALAGVPGERGMRIPWWSLPLTAAAGFLIAVMFVKGSRELPAPGSPPPVTDGEMAKKERAEKARTEMAAEVDRLLRTPEVGCVVETWDQKLKKLGAGCVEPAAEWIRKADAETMAFQRRMAARAVADLATREQAGLLIQMVGDADPEVRALANKGLVRVSGVTACSEIETRENPVKARQEWEEWLKRQAAE